MTTRRAERLTGYEIRRLADTASGRIAYGAFRGDELVAEADHLTDDLALKILVERIYRLHCLIVLEQHGWTCSRCHEVKQLQIHHKTYRSHGGTHMIDNLEPVCWDCHHVIHRLERSQ